MSHPTPFSIKIIVEFGLVLNMHEIYVPLDVKKPTTNQSINYLYYIYPRLLTVNFYFNNSNLDFVNVLFITFAAQKLFHRKMDNDTQNNFKDKFKTSRYHLFSGNIYKQKIQRPITKMFLRFTLDSLKFQCSLY